MFPSSAIEWSVGTILAMYDPRGRSRRTFSTPIWNFAPIFVLSSTFHYTVFCKTYCVSRKVRFESLNFFALRNMARTFALVRNGTYLVKVEAVTNHWDGAVVRYRKAGDSFSWLKVISVALTEEEASPEGAVKYPGRRNSVICVKATFAMFWPAIVSRWNTFWHLGQYKRRIFTWPTNSWQQGHFLDV
jgi:hypothetical protein